MYVVRVILTGEMFALVMFVSVCGYEYLLGCYEKYIWLWIMLIQVLEIIFLHTELMRFIWCYFSIHKDLPGKWNWLLVCRR